MSERIGYPEIQTYSCKECDNYMIPDMYPSEPFIGVLLRCEGCDREVELEGKHDEVKV